MIFFERYCLSVARSVRSTLPSFVTSAFLNESPLSSFLSTRLSESVERSVTSIVPLRSTSPRRSPFGFVDSVGLGESVGFVVSVGSTVGFGEVVVVAVAVGSVVVAVAVAVGFGEGVGLSPPSALPLSSRNEAIHASGEFQLIVTSFVDQASIEST